MHPNNACWDASTCRWPVGASACRCFCSWTFYPFCKDQIAVKKNIKQQNQNKTKKHEGVVSKPVKMRSKEFSVHSRKTVAALGNEEQGIRMISNSYPSIQFVFFYCLESSAAEGINQTAQQLGGSAFMKGNPSLNVNKLKSLNMAAGAAAKPRLPFRPRATCPRASTNQWIPSCFSMFFNKKNKYRCNCL